MYILMANKNINPRASLICNVLQTTWNIYSMYKRLSERMCHVVLFYSILVETTIEETTIETTIAPTIEETTIATTIATTIEETTIAKTIATTNIPSTTEWTSVSSHTFSYQYKSNSLPNAGLAAGISAGLILLIALMAVLYLFQRKR